MVTNLKNKLGEMNDNANSENVSIDTAIELNNLEPYLESRINKPAPLYLWKFNLYKKITKKVTFSDHPETYMIEGPNKFITKYDQVFAPYTILPMREPYTGDYVSSIKRENQLTYSTSTTQINSEKVEINNTNLSGPEIESSLDNQD